MPEVVGLFEGLTQFPLLFHAVLVAPLHVAIVPAEAVLTDAKAASVHNARRSDREKMVPENMAPVSNLFENF